MSCALPRLLKSQLKVTFCFGYIFLAYFLCLLFSRHLVFEQTPLVEFTSKADVVLDLLALRAGLFVVASVLLLFLLALLLVEKDAPVFKERCVIP